MKYNYRHMPVTPEEAAQTDLSPFFEHESTLSPEARDTNFQASLRLLRKFHPIDSSSRFFEIGTGSGWFQVNCLRNGLQCEGIELTPQLAAMARDLGKRYGVQPNIRLGNIEEAAIGTNLYDFVIADSVLEHVPDWKTAIRRVYIALKPGGIFYFSSTNKFSLISGEYSKIPLYGWLPDRARRWIRRKIQGPNVMLWAMDSNQFRYPPLRRFLKQTGFHEVFDYVEMKDVDGLNYSTPFRRLGIKILKSSRLAKRVFLTFMGTTAFLCRK